MTTSISRLRAAMPLLQRTASHTTTRTFQTSQRLADTIAPVRRPIGAFRGTIFGFLLGSVAAGYGMYYYVIDDYKVSNGLLTEDIYALQSAVQRLDDHVRSLEENVKGAGKS